VLTVSLKVAILLAMVKEYPEWLTQLSSVVAAAPEFKSWPAFEVAFLSTDSKVGLDLSSGAITDGSRATCSVSGAETVFRELVTRTMTLQKAYASKLVELAGAPENLLRLALVFERCQRPI